MKEDAAAKELEELLRDALKTGVDQPRSGAGPIQLSTVPLKVQPVPMKPAARVQAPPVAQRESIPGLADKLAPESVRPPAPAKKPEAKSGSSIYALIAVGAFALAFGGGAWWLRTHSPPEAATAPVAPVAPAAEPTTSEGAVGIAVAARPAPAPSAAESTAPQEAKPAEAKPAETKPVAAEPAPAPVAAAPAVTTAETKPAAPVPVAVAPSKPEPKEAKEAKPAPTHRHAAPAPRPEAPKGEKTATADKPEKKEAAPAPAAPAGGSVDALLQQQLKGAIP